MSAAAIAANPQVSLSQWFANLEADAAAKLKTLGQEAEAVIESVGTVIYNATTATLEELGSFALNAVVVEAPKIISGQEKFGNAVTNVVESVEAQGKTVLIQDAQLAVQGAVKAFQSASAKAA